MLTEITLSFGSTCDIVASKIPGKWRAIADLLALRDHIENVVTTSSPPINIVTVGSYRDAYRSATYTTCQKFWRLSMTKFFYYFAYGSNLLKERIRVQIKGAEYECNGVLRNYKVDFVATSRRWHGGLATIKEKPGAEVHGCVWRVPDDFAEELDRQEAGYHRLTVPIECSDCVIECRTYQYSNEKAPSEPPSPHYKTVILAGAVEHALPASYTKDLAAFPDNGYKGRVEVDIDVIKHLNQA